MNLLFYCKLLFSCKVLFYCKVNPLQKKLTIFKMSGTSKKITETLKTILCKNMNQETESLNAMNVTTVLQEKIVLFIASAKILECKGSISPSCFYGQLPNY